MTGAGLPLVNGVEGGDANLMSGEAALAGPEAISGVRAVGVMDLVTGAGAVDAGTRLVVAGMGEDECLAAGGQYGGGWYSLGVEVNGENFLRN